MKLLVMADSHGALPLMQAALDREKPDMLIHLGDGVEQVDSLAALPPRLWRVRGNCDIFSSWEETVTGQVAGFTLMATHGHRWQVKMNCERLVYAAREAGAHIVLFGHTHVPALEQAGGVMLVNPGAMAQGRYAVLALRAGQAPQVEHKRVGHG